MQLLIIRHAVAEDRDDWARTRRSDDERPLTEDGRKKFRRGARGLVTQVPVLHGLVASPLVRAQETAALVSAAYGGLELLESTTLRPETPPARTFTWLRSQLADVLAIVGHEPHLGALVAQAIGAPHGARTPLKKGGAVLLSFRGAPKAGAATLVWALTPRQLRALGDA
jgi:phosphohistidine phosphatase